MRPSLILLTAAICLPFAGCGASDAGMHPLKIVFPENDCRQTTDFCSPWKGCYDLGIKKIIITVGDAHGQVQTTFRCEVDAPAVNLKVYYFPNREPYNIELRYSQGDSEIVVSKEGLVDDESVTPWQVEMR